MKIVNIIGGLGNQMFQYSLAVVLENIYSDEVVKIDTQLYRFPLVKKFKGNNFYHNGYEISRIFPNANLPLASCVDLMRNSFFFPNYILNKAIRRLVGHRKTELVQNYKHAYVYESSVLESKCSYYDGYWMNPAYFDDYRDAVWETFTFKEFTSNENVKWASMLSSDSSVTLHVRRGDYVGGSTFKDICTLAYYRNAINEARKYIEEPVFYVFSNDQGWCLENLKNEFGDSEVHFIGNNKGDESYRDMQLMTLARCNILANSSFSWWGAYLNKRHDHLTFCPERWVNNLECDGICLNDWKKISIR